MFLGFFAYWIFFCLSDILTRIFCIQILIDVSSLVYSYIFDINFVFIAFWISTPEYLFVLIAFWSMFSYASNISLSAILFRKRNPFCIVVLTKSKICPSWKNSLSKILSKVEPFLLNLKFICSKKENAIWKQISTQVSKICKVSHAPCFFPLFRFQIIKKRPHHK